MILTHPVPRPGCFRKHKLGICRRRARGMAIIVMLAILSILLVYITANLQALYNLERELKLTEQHQTRRLQAISERNARETGTTPAPVGGR